MTQGQISRLILEAQTVILKGISDLKTAHHKMEFLSANSEKEMIRKIENAQDAGEM